MPTISQGDDLKNRIFRLMAYRLAIVTLLMVGTAFIHLKEGGRLLTGSLIPTYVIVGTSYLVTLLSIFTLRFVKKFDWFGNLQVAADTLLATSLVYATGGADSIFSFLYIFIIIGGGIVLQGKGSFLTASLSSILYGALLVLQYYGYLPTIESPFSQTQDYSGIQIFYRVFGNITAFYAVAVLSRHLILQLRETGERLKEKEIDYEALDALNKKIVHEIDSGIVTIDHIGFITSFNKAAEDITGYTLREAYMAHIHEIFPGLMDRYNPEALFRKGPLRLEMSHMNRDASLLHLGFSISSRKDHEGGETGSIIIFQDLTPYREMEEAVRRAEKLSAVGKLAAGIAHEIRNPLASISGSIQVLRNELEVNNDNKRLMDIILREIERLNRLITEFLDYARPYKPLRNEVYFSRVIAETLDVFEKGLPQERGITIRRDITEELKVYGEHEKLQEVMWNLLNNAAQAMPFGGEITVLLETKDGFAVAAIKDSGEGIDEENIGKVFEPFFTTKSSGTGLGLATVYRIIEAHDGQVRVESKKGEGTTFTVTIPLVQE